MIHYSADVGVARPAAEVFDAVNDIAGWTAWTDMRDVQPEGTGAVHVGSAGTFLMPKGPFKGPIRYEATALDPDRRVAYRMTHPAFEWDAVIGGRARRGRARACRPRGRSGSTAGAACSSRWCGARSRVVRRPSWTG